MDQPKYLLTEEAWGQVLASQAYFEEYFQLTDSGICAADNDPRLLNLQQSIFSALGIEPGCEHSVSALMRICCAAQFARGLLVSEVDSDGTRRLYSCKKH